MSLDISLFVSLFKCKCFECSRWCETRVRSETPRRTTLLRGRPVGRLRSKVVRQEARRTTLLRSWPVGRLRSKVVRLDAELHFYLVKAKKANQKSIKS